MWSFSISSIHCSGRWFSDLELSKVEIVREKKTIHKLMIETLLAFYLLSCFDFSRAYLSCLSSKEHFYSCANKQWSVHEGHSTVAVCEGCSERLSFNTTVHGKPNFQLYVSAGKSSCSQSACCRVIQNTAYCRLWFLFQDSFLFIPFCAKYNKQNRSWRQFGWGNNIQ